jgi:hypothetical protein
LGELVKLNAKIRKIAELITDERPESVGGRVAGHGSRSAERSMAFDACRMTFARFRLSVF